MATSQEMQETMIKALIAMMMEMMMKKARARVVLTMRKNVLFRSMNNYCKKKGNSQR